jgi:hypothetical protein
MQKKIKKEIITDVDLSNNNLFRLQLFARKLAAEKKAKILAETVPMDKRVYVIDYKLSGLMTSHNGEHAMLVSGKQAAENFCRELGKKFGKKFYCEEVINF